MIERIFLKLVFVLGALAIGHSAELNTNEAEAKIFLNQTSDKLFSVYDDVAKAKASIGVTIFDEARLNVSTVFKRIIKDSKKFDFENFKDEELKYAFKILLKVADLRIIKREDLLELLDSLDGLVYLETYNANIGKQKSNDQKKLQHYWDERRDEAGDWAEDDLDEILDALKNAAKVNKLSPLEFWLRGFKVSEMEKLMADIQPLYMELHAFIRNLLQKKYGDSVIEADGLIPEHLFEHVLQQARSNESIIEEMFPYKSLPPVESVMMERFNSTQLHEIAEEFYEKLGFEKYPSSIWGDRIKVHSYHDDDDDDSSEELHEDDDDDSNEKEDHDDDDDDDDEDDDDDDDDDDKEEDDDKVAEDVHENEDDIDDDECYPIISYTTPNILLEFCEKMKFKDFLDAYANMGYLHYAKEMKGLPAYYFEPPNGLEYAIGKAIILSASTHHNLKAIGLISNFDITPKVEMNRLLRMAIRQLLQIPLDFVHTKIMADLVSGNIKKAGLNKHYWNLMDKYVGVGPPKDHKSSNYDLPYEFYEKMANNLMSIDFTMEILSYQMHKKLCELSGNKEELHLCDINGSKDAGNALKKMMQLGISKPYHEVLATMFPENPTVRSDSLLEYYNPIKKLIGDKNKEANVKPGWKNSKSDKV